MPKTPTEELYALYKEIDDCQDCELGELRMNRAPRLRFKPGKKPVLVVSQNPAMSKKPPVHVVPNCDHVWGGLNILFRPSDSNGPDRAREIADAVWITNVVKCRTPNNNEPTLGQERACKKWLDQEIELIKPKSFIALGNTAKIWLTRNNSGPLTSFYHPSHMFRFKHGEIGRYLKELEAITRSVK